MSRRFATDEQHIIYQLLLHFPLLSMQRVLLERTGVPDELHHGIYAIVRGGRV